MALPTFAQVDPPLLLRWNCTEATPLPPALSDPVAASVPLLVMALACWRGDLHRRRRVVQIATGWGGAGLIRVLAHIACAIDRADHVEVRRAVRQPRVGKSL